MGNLLRLRKSVFGNFGNPQFSWNDPVVLSLSTFKGNNKSAYNNLIFNDDGRFCSFKSFSVIF